MCAQEWSALEPFHELRMLQLQTHSSWVEQISAVAIYVSGFIDIWKLLLAIKQKLQFGLKKFTHWFSPLLLIVMPFHFSRAA